MNQGKEEKLIKTDGVPEVIDSFESGGARISIISPAFKIEDDLAGDRIVKKLERCGRVCYKSEPRITEGSAFPFIKHAIGIGHFSIIEHEKVTIRLIVDRGVSHEWVRHRLAAYSQESTRYCNYGKLGFQYIYPFFYPIDSPQYEEWKKAITDATLHYLELLKIGSKPQEARGVLPNSLKTELIATHNIREWRHIFHLRGQAGAHPQFRQILLPILRDFREKIPVLFDDLEIDWEKKVVRVKPIEELLSILQELDWFVKTCPANEDRKLAESRIEELRTKIGNMNLAR